MKMISYKKVCICGGGSLGHVLAAVLNQAGCSVNLLTGKPEKWEKKVEVQDPSGKSIRGELSQISHLPKEVIPETDLVILCLPGYMIHKTLLSIRPYLSENTQVGTVVSSTGFFWIARSLLGSEQKLFGFQRVPFICRVTKYGSQASIKGYKPVLKIAGSRNNELDSLTCFFENCFNTPVILLDHYLEASLTNSNPLLHPARIYSILQKMKNGTFDKEIFFYEEWDDFSSETLINCDNEFQKILSLLPVNQTEVPTILDYYESSDASSLTYKMRSIQAFQGIKLNMLKTGQTFRLNLEDRYFTEDIPYGLLIIKSISTVLDQQTPAIDKVIEKIQQQMHRSYLESDKLSGKDLKETGIVQNYGITSIQQLSSL